MFAPHISCSLLLPAASNPGNSQALRWLRTIQSRVLKQWLGAIDLLEGKNEWARGKVGGGQREATILWGQKSECMEFHHFLEPTINSVYEGDRKFGLHRPSRLWLLPLKTSTDLDWWSINLLASLFPLFSLSVSPGESWNIIHHWENHSELILAAPPSPIILLMNTAQCRFLMSLHQQLIDLLRSK